jgi:hypothetical protein
MYNFTLHVLAGPSSRAVLRRRSTAARLLRSWVRIAHDMHETLGS